MQLKSIRPFTLVEVLEATFSLVPLEKRSGASVEFKILEKTLEQNLEAMYKIATQRLLHLSYYLEWSRTIKNKKELKPEPLDVTNIDYVAATFCVSENMNLEETKFLNNSFSSWINNQTIRELNEFLKHYLAELHETCTVLEYTKHPIKPKDMVDIKKECKKFEKGGLKERLKILRKKYSFKLTHHEDVLGLYEVRNIFSHFDGIVMKRFCNKEGYLKISWPQNTYKYKKKGKNEWVPHHKIKRPFSADMYESVQITWLGKSEVRKYKPMEQINLSYKDLSNLIFFYLYVFNELHKRLVGVVNEGGIKTKPFKDYILHPNFIGFISD